MPFAVPLTALVGVVVGISVLYAEENSGLSVPNQAALWTSSLGMWVVVHVGTVVGLRRVTASDGEGSGQLALLGTGETKI